MSFSFRNIFSPDEGDIEGAPTGFAPPTGAGGGDLSRGGMDAGPAAAEVQGQEFLVSELIAFIPPAISAQSGIPMMREVRIPLPADGSRDVKLSTIYQICPELFAAEITPLNDSTVTLPPKLGAMGTGPTAGSTGFSPPAAKASSAFATAPPTSFSGAPQTTPPAASNPFWSPAPTRAEGKKGTGTPDDRKDETPLARQDGPSVRPIEATGGHNPFSAQAPAAQVPAKGNAFTGSAPEAQNPAGVGPSAPGDDAFSGGFSAFESKLSSALFGGDSGVVRNEADEKGGKATAGSSFENEHGFNTLFSKKAEVDTGIPFPTGPAPEAVAKAGEPADELQGVWGAMFHGGGLSDSGEAAPQDQPFSPPAFESIGNLLKQGASSAAPPASAGFQSAPESAATPASPPMTPTNAIPNGFSAFEPAPEGEVHTPAPQVKAFEGPPVQETPSEIPSATGFPAFATPARGFAEFGKDTVPTPSPIDSFAGGADFAAPTALAEPAPEPVSAPVREVRESAMARPVAPVKGEAGFDMRDLELRAIFSTSEIFTLSMVARRVVGLPGIVNCSLSTPGRLVQASKSEEGRIGNEAREMVTTLRNLAKLTGLPEARTFTLHTDRGIVSLFLEGECCVMVHHEAAAFEPGVREKLILVARSLINLEE